MHRLDKEGEGAAALNRCACTDWTAGRGPKPDAVLRAQEGEGAAALNRCRRTDWAGTRLAEHEAKFLELDILATDAPSEIKSDY